VEVFGVINSRILLCTLAVAMVIVRAPPATAQEPAPTQRDSLLAELRALRVRLDSLEQVVGELRAKHGDTTEVVDELAALRAAAAAAAAEADTTRGAEAPSQGGGLLNRLNPEISVTGDVRGSVSRPGPQTDVFEVREFEFSFQAALDPYASTKVFLAWEDGRVDLEEGYLYWSGLPGGIGVDLGRFRQQLGKINRVHLHALPESEYPLVTRTYFGEEGLIGDGARLYWMAPFAGLGRAAHELWGEFTVGGNDVLFEGGDRLSFLGHLNNFWQLSRSSFFQFGLTGRWGEHPDEDLESRVLGADLRFTWRPPGRELYRSFTVRGEVYGARKRRAGDGNTRYGGYLGAEYQFGRGWFTGARFDYVERLEGPSGIHDWAIVPHLTWFQSEWVYLRGEWQHHSSPGLDEARETSDRFLIQVVWAVGPHKHESY
jgi:hypothetical protein